MALQTFLETLDRLETEATDSFAAVTDADSLEQVRVRFLGAKKRRPQRRSKTDGRHRSDRPQGGGIAAEPV